MKCAIQLDAQCAPSLSLAGPNMSPLARYIAIGLDLDAPFPTLALLSPILHWVQADYQLVPSLPNRMATNAGLLESSSPFVADYVGPAPPPGSYPHRYMFLLYEQPENCNIQEQAPPGGKPLGNWMRMRFDLHKWEIKNGLGNPVAMNYFLSN